MASGARATRPQKEYQREARRTSIVQLSICHRLYRNSRGNWVAQEQNGLYGGLFVNRAQAVKYALFENGHHPETIVELSREIELDMGGKLSSSANTPAASVRRVA